MLKKIIAFILVLSMALSLCAFAETTPKTTSARSATILVTVLQYEIEKSQLLGLEDSDETDAILATYEVKYGDGQASGTTWKFTQDGEEIKVGVVTNDKGSLATLTLKDLTVGSELVNEITVKAEATITSHDKEYPTKESVEMTFIILNDGDEEEEVNPTDPKHENNEEQDGKDFKDGKDDNDKITANGALEYDISASKYSAKDGDNITVTVTPKINENLKTNLDKYKISYNVKTSLYLSEAGKTGVAQKIDVEGEVEITFDFTALFTVKTYYAWAAGTLSIDKDTIPVPQKTKTHVEENLGD